MLTIEKYSDEKCRTISYKGEEDIFVVALRYVREGENRFHIKNELGDDFDLLYQDNGLALRQNPNYIYVPHKDKEILTADLLSYDENNKESILLDYYDDYHTFCFDRVNEYTITLARVLLKFTDKTVYFNDERYKWFLKENERLFGSENYPDKDNKDVLFITEEFYELQERKGFNRRWEVSIFTDFFLLQWMMSDLPLKQIKYIEFSPMRIEGIGSILVNLSKMSEFGKRFGIKTYLNKNSIRYDEKLIGKYFNVLDAPKDANKNNTIYFNAFFVTFFSEIFYKTKPILDSSYFKQFFIDEMEEYANAIIGNKRMLGILIRGTDYISAGIPLIAYNDERLVPIIDKALIDYKFDGIFLATEDADRLASLKEKYKDKIITVSQVRYKQSDFVKDKTFYEKEQKEKMEEVEDTFVNYLYSIYLLSKCAGFISTPETNGTSLVRSINDKFEFLSILMDRKVDNQL